MRFKIAASLSLLILAGSSAANAGLIVRDVGVTLNAANLDSYDLDVDQDGTADFTFTAAFVPDPDFAFGFDTADSPPGSSNGVVIDATTGDGLPTASLLGAGDVVSAASLFSVASSDQANLFFFSPLGPPSGHFEGRTGILGLRFDGAGGSVFGFAQVTVNALGSGSDPLGLTIGLVGYETVPGRALVIPGVPEPSSLILCGVGIVAAMGSRRRHRG